MLINLLTANTTPLKNDVAFLQTPETHTKNHVFVFSAAFDHHSPDILVSDSWFCSKLVHLAPSM